MDIEFEKVRRIICEQLDVDESQVTADASIIDDLGAGSIDTIELVMALESEFGIDIPEEDAERLITVNDVVSYIRLKL
ncbi:MAG TPA: acyl carrier protein [Spirochaetota bacterium]|nr:acyl carrier protein [Spirochaetota bacterium]HPR49491.1 acyl carrier protein [Spirochaetota bacterium]